MISKTAEKIQSTVVDAFKGNRVKQMVSAKVSKTNSPLVSDGCQGKLITTATVIIYNIFLSGHYMKVLY